MDQVGVLHTLLRLVEDPLGVLQVVLKLVGVLSLVLVGVFQADVKVVVDLKL